MLPYVFPILIWEPVDNIFRIYGSVSKVSSCSSQPPNWKHTIFVAVPALSLVLPVTTSGPVTHSIATSQNGPRALGLTQATPTVDAPTDWACLSPPITYGVRPDDAIPTTTSFSLTVEARSSRSIAPACSESSASSTAFRIAWSPPAMIPTNWLGGAENVGGLFGVRIQRGIRDACRTHISDASRIPSLSGRRQHRASRKVGLQNLTVRSSQHQCRLHVLRW